jgi:hypothetical protein
MSKPARVDDFEAAVLARLDRIESLVLEGAARKRKASRAGNKRAKTVAERAAAGVRYRPTELQMAAMRRKLRGG